MEGFFFLFFFSCKKNIFILWRASEFYFLFFLFSKLIYIKLQQWKQLIHSLVELTAAQKKNPELFSE